ncbi:J domain-containing protein [Sphaerothrix gracilis]|uniref:J domain-containing protein n=1 Tax=Sphaerothrix gracilis TaxID=3151835 RepID=UPI0031FD735F
MQNFRNYYEILEVSKGASVEEVKRAYRRLARQYHPDMNPGDKSAEERFKQLGEAYEVLSDPERRSQYEEFSSFWKQKGFRGRKGANGRGGLSLEDLDFGEFRDFNSFVDQLLNRRREASNGAKPQRGRTVTEDPYRPAKSKTAYTVQSKTASRRDAEASLTLPLEKAYSGGRERVRLEDGRSLEVNMPPGMITGQRIRLKGQGIGGGNLYLRIEVQPHSFFKLQGDDIFCQVPLTPSEAALGGLIEVPTLDGLVKMNIPAGVQSGQRLRLASKGYPIGQNRRGDQIVQVEIAVPSTLSDREKELYQELRRTETFNPRADLPGS